jgi:ribosomal protein L1
MLGSHVIGLLNDRIKTGINFALNERNVEVDWFLSGGIKNPDESTISEAYKMSEMISKSDEFSSKSEWNYILDEISTNTAENFFMVKKMLENNPGKYSKVYVVTSDFHFKRASKFADKIIENNNFEWILSELELHDSMYWETIHSKNIDNDVEKALKKFQ